MKTARKGDEEEADQANLRIPYLIICIHTVPEAKRGTGRRNHPNHRSQGHSLLDVAAVPGRRRFPGGRDGAW